MIILTETRVVRLPAEKVRSTLIDYFASKAIKTEVTETLMKATHGPCALTIKVFPENGKSRVEFTPHYRRKYIIGFGVFLVLVVLLDVAVILMRRTDLVAVNTGFVLAIALAISGEYRKRTNIINELMALLTGMEKAISE